MIIYISILQGIWFVTEGNYKKQLLLNWCICGGFVEFSPFFNSPSALFSCTLWSAGKHGGGPSGRVLQSIYTTWVIKKWKQLPISMMRSVTKLKFKGPRCVLLHLSTEPPIWNSFNAIKFKWIFWEETATDIESICLRVLPHWQFSG